MSTSSEITYLIPIKLATNSSIQCHAVGRSLYALVKCGDLGRKKEKEEENIWLKYNDS